VQLQEKLAVAKNQQALKKPAVVTRKNNFSYYIFEKGASCTLFYCLFLPYKD
jgi:hypothetical protein